jgi:hypothetical protein
MRLAQADPQFLRCMLRGLAGGHPGAQLGHLQLGLLPLDRRFAGGTVQTAHNSADTLPGDFKFPRHLKQSQVRIGKQGLAQAQTEVGRGEQVSHGE